MTGVSTKISDLPLSLAIANNDLLPMVQSANGVYTSKKITAQNLFASSPAYVQGNTVITSNNTANVVFYSYAGSFIKMTATAKDTTTDELATADFLIASDANSIVNSSISTVQIANNGFTFAAALNGANVNLLVSRQANTTANLSINYVVFLS